MVKGGAHGYVRFHQPDDGPAFAPVGGAQAHGRDRQLPQLTPATPGTLIGTCESLLGRLSGLDHTTITTATTVAAGTLSVAGTPVPVHCRVTGFMYQRVSPVDGKTYSIQFEMRLPVAWNGRFFHQGNGGIDGSVVTANAGFGGGALTTPLLQGFAVLSSDAGHSNAQGGPAFGLDPQARLDYGYQAVGKLTPMAKQAIGLATGVRLSSLADTESAVASITEADLLAVAAGVETGSSHPLAIAILNKAKDAGVAALTIHCRTANMGHSGAARAGMVNLTETAAFEWAQYGVRVNAVAPGFIATAMTKAMPKEVIDQMAAKVPVARLGETADIANACLFLASEQSSYINGTVLSVDGGIVL